MRITLCLLLGLLPGALRAAERTEYTLANGLHVKLVPSDAEKKISVLLAVRAGFLEEPAGVPHLAHVTEHLTVFGLPPGSPEAQAVDRWAPKNQANGETLADLMYLDLYPEPAELELALKIQARRLAAPVFSKEILAREIPRTLAEIDTVKRFPGGTSKFALAPFVQAAFHQAKDVPMVAKTKAITLDQVQAFHDRTFRPDRAALVVVGAFDPQAVRPMIETAFGGIPRPAPAAARPQVKPGTHPVTWDVGTRHLFLAWNAPAAEHADHPALVAAGTLLTQQLYLDAEFRKLVALPQVLTETEGLFLVSLGLQADADPARVRQLVLEKIARLGKPEGVPDAAWLFQRQGLVKNLEPMDVDRVPLPPNVTRTLARTNVELQLLMRELVWGDLAAYRKRLSDLGAPAVRAAVGKYLTEPQACVVVLTPSGPGGD